MLILALLTSADAGVVRHALLVGSNDGGSSLSPLLYAEQDAERMHQVLSELGGFAPERITVLYEPDRDELLAALQEHAFIGQQNDEDMFLFYYSGHATARGLKLGEETLPYEELRGSMNELSSEVRLGVLDACRSGEITRLKGLTLSEPFATDDALSAKGEAWLTASSADEDAQESDRLRGSFFTHYLVSGLRGAADHDDGVVSLSEAYAYAYDQTVSRTGRTDTGTQHPSYDFRIQGEGDLPLTDVRRASATLTIPEDIAGVLTVLSWPEETPLVEVSKKLDVVTIVALPPGQYQIRLKDAYGTGEARIGLTEGANLILPDFVGEEMEVAMRKGAEPEVQEPPPLFYDPAGPRLIEKPEDALAALAAFRERTEANINYQSRRANSWLGRRLPGSTSIVSTVLGTDDAETEPIGEYTYHYSGVCDTVGSGCLHVATAAERLDGTATITFPDGTRAAEGILAEGIPNGQWAFYYENGQRHSTGSFSNGVTYGEWIWWYPDGQKRQKGQLQGEARVGTWQEWYDTGKRKSRTEYTNGALDGRRVDWYPTGQKKSEGRMLGERLDGDWTFYYEDGRKKTRGAYNERGRTGIWTTWSPNGIKSSKGRYSNDLRHGKWALWWDNGVLSSEGSYNRGKKEGRWESSYRNSTLRSQAAYVDGRLDGRYIEWDSRGAMVERGWYRDGERVGRWTRWDDDGVKQTERFSRTQSEAIGLQ